VRVGRPCTYDDTCVSVLGAAAWSIAQHDERTGPRRLNPAFGEEGWCKLPCHGAAHASKVPCRSRPYDTCRTPHPRSSHRVGWDDGTQRVQAPHQGDGEGGEAEGEGGSQGAHATSPRLLLLWRGQWGERVELSPRRDERPWERPRLQQGCPLRRTLRGLPGRAGVGVSCTLHRKLLTE
jgi:hypothetical protein